MVKKRTLNCDCGGTLKEKETSFEGLQTEAMVCTRCSFTTLSKEQAKAYLALKQLHDIVDARRKIIKIGNSMGITLPEGLKTMGLRVGKSIRVEAIGPRSFKIEL